MGPVAERLLFREATAAELRIFDSTGDLSISIDELHSASNSDRSALGINESFNLINVYIVAHGYGLVEVIAKRLRT